MTAREILARSTGLWWATLVALSGALGPACILGEVPLDNKPCPCARGWTCDEGRNLCVRGVIAGDAGPRVEDASPAAEAGVEGGDGATGVDGAGAEDAAVGEDAALGLDAEPAPDALPGQDAVVYPDATPAPDAAPAPDAGPVGPGALGATCAADDQCASRLCLPVSTAGAPLSVCSTPCSSTSDCPIDFACRFESWMSFCLPETAFSPARSFDVPSGGACSAQSNTCHSGVCDTGNNVCVEWCSSEADCASFGGSCYNVRNAGFIQVCVNDPSLGAIGSACMAPDDCRTGLCHYATQECAQHCCSNAECPAGDYCAEFANGSGPVKICRPKTAASQNLAYGAACTMSSQCDSRICGPTDPSGAGPRQCSTLCCEDSDCAVLPGGGRCRPFDSSFQGALLGYCIP